MRLALAQAAASDLLHFGIFPRFLCRDSHSTSNRLRQTIMSDDSPQTDCKWSHCIFFPCAIRSLSLSLFLLDFDAHAWVKKLPSQKKTLRVTSCAHDLRCFCRLDAICSKLCSSSISESVGKCSCKNCTQKDSLVHRPAEPQVKSTE